MNFISIVKKLNLLVLSILLLCNSIAISQNIKTTRKVVSIISEQNFYLNGGNRAAMGGKSRNYLLVKLPDHCVEWYYTFTATPNQTPNSNLGLASQLTKLVDPSGLSSIAVSTIFAPTGAGVCNVYLLPDRDNLDKFIRKVDNSGGKITYYMGGTRENFKNGVVKINDVLSGTVYLGFKNPSATTGINVTVEIAAIVEEKEEIQKTENQSKAELYGKLGWQAYQKGDCKKCLELSRKAISLDNSVCWIQCNIALSELIIGESNAMDDDIKAVDLMKKSNNPKSYLSAAINDLKEAGDKKNDLKDMDIIMGLLKDEYSKY